MEKTVEVDIKTRPQQLDYPPCVVCALEGIFSCTVCKTRYCSTECQ